MTSPQPGTLRPRTASGLAFALTSAIAFGLSGALAAPLLDAGWSAGAVVLVRVGLAALVVAPFGIRALRGQWHLLRRNAGLIAAYGLLAVAVTQFCFFSAIGHMQVGPALLIEYTAPAAVVVWFWLRHGQRPGPVTLLGAGLAALGLVLVLDLLSGADISLAGVLWALGAMVGVRVLLHHLRRRVQRAPAADPGRGWPGRRHRRPGRPRPGRADADARRHRTCRVRRADGLLVGPDDPARAGHRRPRLHHRDRGDPPARDRAWRPSWP